MKAQKDPLIVLPAHDFEETIKTIQATIEQYKHQTDIEYFTKADKESLFNYCQWLWQWTRQQIKYRLDAPLKEEIRTPARTWYDRRKGVDCEDYVIFISTILLNNSIPHVLRVADYGSGWSHIYVVVSGANKKEIIIDPVKDRFNTEQPFINKKDYKIRLNEKGLSGIEQHYPEMWRNEFKIVYLRKIPPVSFKDIAAAQTTAKDKYFLKTAKASLKAGKPYIAYADAYNTFRSYVYDDVMWGVGTAHYLISADDNFVYVSSVRLEPIMSSKKTNIDSTKSSYFKIGDRVKNLHNKEKGTVKSFANKNTSIVYYHIKYDNPKINGQNTPETLLELDNSKEHPTAKSQPAASKKAKAFDINQQIEQLLDSQTKFNQVQLRYLRNYTGSGGKAKDGATGEGILYEFYTPDWVAQLMWEIAQAHGYEGGNVLETSCGTGVFLDTAPESKENTFVGFEVNPYSAKIAQLLHPNAKIYNQYFETAFLDPQARFRTKLKSKLTWLDSYPFDLVIGNPPYGIYQNQYSSYFPELKKMGIKQMEIAFVYWGLKMLNTGGLLVYVTSQNFIRTGFAYQDAKEALRQMADLVDAYRLPSVFESTSVPTDILVLRKK